MQSLHETCESFVTFGSRTFSTLDHDDGFIFMIATHKQRQNGHIIILCPCLDCVYTMHNRIRGTLFIKYSSAGADESLPQIIQII